MSNELKESQRRAIRYFYVDGTFEYGFGLLCLILAGYFYAETHTNGWLSALVDASLVLVLICGAYLIQFLIRKLKERITYPRTGYVSYRRERGLKRGWRVVLGFIVGGVAAGAISLLVMNQNIMIAVLPLVSGTLFGLVLFILGWRTAVARFYLLGLLSAVMGVTLAFSGLEYYSSLIGYYAGFAVVLLGTGTCVLLTYIRQNPIQKTGLDEQ
jgi:hypothetical protein